MGWSRLAPETFNCSAPDTGNMEVIERYGIARAEGEMAEAPAGGQDPLGLHHDGAGRRLLGRHQPRAGCQARGRRVGAERREMVRLRRRRSALQDLHRHGLHRSRRADKHKQHSQIFVPAGTKGVEILRAMKVYGDDDAPHGHMHIRFNDVRVPKENLILGRGRGFEVSQGRLGPGRIHHCMRAIGQSERALEMLCRRSLSREAFGKPLAQLGANYDIIAESRMKIEMARLLCLKAAYMMDTVGQRDASPWISQIKVIAPRIALEITDEAVQMHGAMGITQDTPLAHMWTHLRTLRLADGPDAVHRRQVARAELQALHEPEDLRCLRCAPLRPPPSGAWLGLRGEGFEGGGSCARLRREQPPASRAPAVFTPRLTPPRLSEGGLRRSARRCRPRRTQRMTSFAHQAAQIDTVALAQYLEARLPGFKGPITAEKTPTGQSNPTFLLSSPSGRYVLRKKPPGQLLKSAHAVDREYRVMKGAAGHRRAGAAHAASVRGRQRARHRVLRHGVRRRHRVLGPGAAGAEQGAARQGLRRGEPGAGRPAFGRPGQGRASPTSARPAATSPASATAGPSSTARRRPSTSRTWRR